METDIQILVDIYGRLSHDGADINAKKFGRQRMVLRTVLRSFNPPFYIISISTSF